MNLVCPWRIKAFNRNALTSHHLLSWLTYKALCITQIIRGCNFLKDQHGAVGACSPFYRILVLRHSCGSSQVFPLVCVFLRLSVICQSYCGAKTVDLNFYTQAQ